MFNEEFCSSLELHLTLTFKSFTKEELKGFWCDGISSDCVFQRNEDEDDLKIITKAWLGKTGQDEYEMVIHLGKESKERFRIKAGLIDCLPNHKTTDWLEINLEKRKIDLNLK
uniref:hypothetical protein n=1 Tax=Roseivirga sp. TaxID=1964215 RepID=UPI004047AFDA